MKDRPIRRAEYEVGLLPCGPGGHLLLELTSIEDVRWWLDLLEPSHAGLSKTGESYRDALLVIETEQWLGNADPGQEPPTAPPP
jgi:hypothetical protein